MKNGSNIILKIKKVRIDLRNLRRSRFSCSNSIFSHILFKLTETKSILLRIYSANRKKRKNRKRNTCYLKKKQIMF